MIQANTGITVFDLKNCMDLGSGQQEGSKFYMYCLEGIGVSSTGLPPPASQERWSVGGWISDV